MRDLPDPPDLPDLADLVTEKSCPAATLLPPRLQADLLRAHPTVDLRLLAVYLTCALDPHDEGDHEAVLYDDFPTPFAGALWTRWSDGGLPTVFALHPDCPHQSPHAVACARYLDHPGGHSWAPGPGRP